MAEVYSDKDSPIIKKAVDRRNILILLAVFALMAVVYGRIDFTVEPYSSCDLVYYRQMASCSPNLDPEVQRPFAYRFLGPLVAGAMPFDDPTNFYILMIILSGCLVILFYFMLRLAGLSGDISLTCTLFFIANKYAFGLPMWDYFQVNDQLSMCMSIVMLISIWRRRWSAYGIALAIGVAAREAAILMIPVMFVYLLERRLLRENWRSALLASAPGLAGFLAIRAFMPFSGGDSLLASFMMYSYQLVSVRDLSRLLVNSFLPFSLLPLIFWRSTRDFFRGNLYLAVFFLLVFLSTAFGFDKERLMAPASLVFYILIGSILRRLEVEKTTLILLVVAGFAASLHHNIGRWPLPGAVWTYILTFGSTLAVVLIILLRKSRGSGDDYRVKLPA